MSIRGAEARLGYLGHVVTENRHGLIVDTRLTQASGTAERDATLEMFGNKAPSKLVTPGGDKGYDTRDFVARTRDLNVTLHVAQNDTNRRSAIDGRTTRREGYDISQALRKRVEEVFGWLKTVSIQRKTRFRGLDRVGWMFALAAAAYNLAAYPLHIAASPRPPASPEKPKSVSRPDSNFRSRHFSAAS